MSKTSWAWAIALIFLLSPAQAEQAVTLGFGRLFNNDLIGDTKDRWRTGSYTLSWVRGADWDGVLPAGPGELLELRLRAEIIAPADLADPDPTDRRYVGALSFGLHTHFDLGMAEIAAGADLVITGPQTGLGRFQRNIHDLFNLDETNVLGDQIPNGVHPTLLTEVGHSYRIGDSMILRPFAEAQAGVETYLRVGGDLSIGGQWRDALMIRDSSTGQRYVGIPGQQPPGLSFSVGGDVAHVFDSVYLPSGEPAMLSDTRSRLRAGIHWQGEKTDMFYGVTLLGKEFDTQPDTQLVGSLRLNLKF